MATEPLSLVKSCMSWAGGAFNSSVETVIPMVLFQMMSLPGTAWNYIGSFLYRTFTRWDSNQVVS